MPHVVSLLPILTFKQTIVRIQIATTHKCHALDVSVARGSISYNPAISGVVKTDKELLFLFPARFEILSDRLVNPGKKTFSFTALFTFFDHPLAGLFAFFTVLIRLIARS